jgi:hypothetical protein
LTYWGSEAIAVGSLAFVETVKNDLGVKARHRDAMEADGTFALRDRLKLTLANSPAKVRF